MARNPHASYEASDHQRMPIIPKFTDYIANNLTTTVAGYALDARQGKTLDDKITSLNNSLPRYSLVVLYPLTASTRPASCGANGATHFVWRLSSGLKRFCVASPIFYATRNDLWLSIATISDNAIDIIFHNESDASIVITDSMFSIRVMVELD